MGKWGEKPYLWGASKLHFWLVTEQILYSCRIYVSRGSPPRSVSQKLPILLDLLLYVYVYK